MKRLKSSRTTHRWSHGYELEVETYGATRWIKTYRLVNGFVFEARPHLSVGEAKQYLRSIGQHEEAKL